MFLGLQLRKAADQTLVHFIAMQMEKRPCSKREKKHMGVSKNRGTPKWMVYNGKPY